MVAATASPLIKGAAHKIKTADRPELIKIYKQYHDYKLEWLRRLIREQNRIDILATEVLGLTVKPMHLSMMQFQFLHRESLQLAYRGAGKSSVCTVTKTIHLLIKNPELRIVLASKTKGNAEGFLTEIKQHMENNELLNELFGPFYDPGRVTKWNDSEITIVQKKRPTKEASVTCVGAESAVVSRHYDVILADDLVDEDNSRTKAQRDKLKTWVYQTLEPTLEPPDDNVPHRGEYHRLGTRYHFDDLYNHLIKNELADHHQIVPALDEKGRSPWPERQPPPYFKKKRQRMGTIIFNCQYQCDTEAMKGEIFQYDDCQQIDDSDIPYDQLKIFGGVDLAITEDEQNDECAVVMGGFTGKIGTDDVTIYVLDYVAGLYRFSKQTQKILEQYDRYDPLDIGVEINQYQRAQLHNLNDVRPNIRVHGIQTDKDKVTRAIKMQNLFEGKRVFFRKNIH
jgi:phage terminase large subunit-like protein